MKTTMKGMKKKRTSIVARGPRAKASVFNGRKEKTTSGLTKAMLFKNKHGKVVSKAASAAGKKAFKNISKWTVALASARKALNIKGFVPVNGNTAEGKALYAKAKSLYHA